MDDDGDQDNVIEEDFYTFLNVPKNVRDRYFTYYDILFGYESIHTSTPRDFYYFIIYRSDEPAGTRLSIFN